MTDLKICPVCGGTAGGRHPCRCQRTGASSSAGTGEAVLLLLLLLAAVGLSVYGGYRYFTAPPGEPLFTGWVAEAAKLVGMYVGGFLAIAAVIGMSYALMRIVKLLFRVELEDKYVGNVGVVIACTAFAIGIYVALGTPIAATRAEQSPTLYAMMSCLISLAAALSAALAAMFLLDVVGAVWRKRLVRRPPERQSHRDWFDSESFEKSIQLRVLGITFWVALTVIAAAHWRYYAWLAPAAIGTWIYLPRRRVH